MQCQEQHLFFATEATDTLPATHIDRPSYSQWRPVLASVMLHGVLAFLILLGGARGAGDVAGAKGGALSVLEVSLLAPPGGLGGRPQPPDAQADALPSQTQQSGTAETADAIPSQAQESETPGAPEDAIPLRVEPPQKNGRQAARRPEREQRPQHKAPASEMRGEDGIRRDGVGDITDQAAGGSASGTPAAVAGDGKPFGFPVGEVSGKPKVIQSVPVVYPAEARKKRMNGQVLVRFHLDENGRVSHLHVKSAEPPDIFNQNTLAAIRRWRFQPAVHNSKTVPVWVELPVEFELR